MEGNIKCLSALPQLSFPSAVGSEDNFNTQGEGLHPPFHEPLLSCVGEGLGPILKGQGEAVRGETSLLPSF